MKYQWIIVIICLVACADKPQPPGGRPPVSVTVVKVETRTIPLVREAVGEVHPNSKVFIKPQVEGKLLEYHVEQGQIVEKGDPICTIDPRPFAAELERARGVLEQHKANLEYAKKRLTRFEQLVEKDFVSQASIDELTDAVATLEAEIVQDKANMALADLRLEYCTVVAPTGGRLGALSFDPGNVVTAYEKVPFTSLMQITPAIVYFALPQRELKLIQEYQKGMEAEVSLLGEKEKGKVYFVDNHVDQATGTVLMKASLANEKKHFWPGAFVKVNVIFTKIPDALMVPAIAVQYSQKGPFVFIVNEKGEVEQRTVEVGEVQEDWVQLKSGVTTGEKVVTRGQLNLRAGAPVAIKKETAA